MNRINSTRSLINLVLMGGLAATLTLAVNIPLASAQSSIPIPSASIDSSYRRITQSRQALDMLGIMAKDTLRRVNGEIDSLSRVLHALPEENRKHRRVLENQVSAARLERLVDISLFYQAERELRLGLVKQLDGLHQALDDQTGVSEEAIKKTRRELEKIEGSLFEGGRRIYGMARIVQNGIEDSRLDANFRRQLGLRKTAEDSHIKALQAMQQLPARMEGIQSSVADAKGEIALYAEILKTGIQFIDAELALLNPMIELEKAGMKLAETRWATDSVQDLLEKISNSTEGVVPWAEEFQDDIFSLPVGLEEDERNRINVRNSSTISDNEIESIIKEGEKKYAR